MHAAPSRTGIASKRPWLLINKLTNARKQRSEAAATKKKKKKKKQRQQQGRSS
jgi:hypothetical protein